MSFSPTRQIADLNQIHEELDQLFFNHQVEILKDNRPRAKVLFQAYGAALKAHLKEEEVKYSCPFTRKEPAPFGGATRKFLSKSTKKSGNGLIG